MAEHRYLLPQVQEDLARKMVFVAGPLQVGKTTLALSLPGAAEGYLSWDIPEHRERIRKVLSLIECKWGDAEVDRSLKYMKARFPEAEAWQIFATGTRDYVTPEGIRVCPAGVLPGKLV